MRTPSPRHQKVLKLLSRKHLDTEQIARKLCIPKAVATTMLHYMEERGMVRRVTAGKAGKRGWPSVWAKALYAKNDPS